MSGSFTAARLAAWLALVLVAAPSAWAQTDPIAPNAAPPTPLAPAAPDLRTTPTAPERNTNPAAITFNFHEEPWENVIKWYADLSGRSLYYQAKPSGTFTYFSKENYSLRDAQDVINDVLHDKGLHLLQRDNFLVVANLANGLPPHLVQRVEVTDLPKLGRTEMVRVLITLKGLLAKNVEEEYKKLVGQHGTIAALPSTNQVLVVDTVRNVQQIVDLINRIEDDGGKADLKVFQLKYVSAVMVEQVVREMLGLGARGTQNSSSSRSSSSSSSGGSDDDRRREFFMRMIAERAGGGPPSPGGDSRSSSSSSTPSSTQVSIDTRTNQIFVTATPEKIAMVSQVIQSLDVPENASEEAADQTPRIEVYPVAPGSADGLSRVLANMSPHAPETRMSAHPDGRALIVYATPAEHKRIKDLLTQFQTEGVKTVVLALRVLDAVATESLLKSLFGFEEDERTARTRMFASIFGRSGDNADPRQGNPSIYADANQNRLLVRGTEEQIKEIKSILSDLGEPGLSEGGLDRSRYRVINIQGHDPQELGRTLDRMWQRMDGNQRNPIQIIDLSQQNAVPPTSGGNAAPPAQEAAPAPGSGQPPLRESPPIPQPDMPPGPPASSTGNQPPQPLPAGQPIPQATRANPTVAAGPAPITVVVGPESIAIASEDPRALELAENLLLTLVQRESTSGPQFSIYYLKASTAQQMAYLLDDVLYGDLLTTSNVIRARIIPDARTNSLLVSGPSAERRKIEELLQVLDREDPPTSGVVAEPRMIPLRYAPASQVVEMVKQAFAPYLYENRQGNRTTSTAAGSSTTGAIPADAVMTVSIDSASNSLIVAAPKPLFDQVADLAQRVDESSRDTQRTVVITTLKNSRPEEVAKALGGLLGVRTTADDPKDEKRQNDANNQNNNNNSQGRDSRRGDDRGAGGGGNFQPPPGFDPRAFFGGDRGGDRGDRGSFDRGDRGGFDRSRSPFGR